MKPNAPLKRAQAPKENVPQESERKEIGICGHMLMEMAGIGIVAQVMEIAGKTGASIPGQAAPNQQANINPKKRMNPTTAYKAS